MNVARFPFLDWMKAIGITLIAWGHFAAGPFTQTTPPVNLKQYGVAFFLFATGFTLARETRPTRRVLFNRLFEVFLYGIAIALIVSAVGFATTGQLALSNYMPFALGVNVLFDNFPANPSTWYIGTYIHVLLFWAIFLRGVKITLPLIGVVLLAEFALRAVLIEKAGSFVAYQALPNWLAVFVLGLYHGQRAEATGAKPGLPVLLASLAAVVAWVVAVATPEPYRFPFNGFTVGNPWADAAATSAAASFDYAVVTLLAFAVTSRLPASRVAEFFSGTTLFVFIAHMPVFYAMRPVVPEYVPSWAGQTAIYMFTGLILLAAVGELLNRVVPAKLLRDRTWDFLSRTRSASPPPDTTPSPAHSGAGVPTEK